MPWCDAGTVITTPRQRGIELARIAHLDFRDVLLEAAKRASGGRAPSEA